MRSFSRLIPVVLMVLTACQPNLPDQTIPRSGSATGPTEMVIADAEKVGEARPEEWRFFDRLSTPEGQTPYSVAFSPDERFLAMGGGKPGNKTGEVRAWEFPSMTIAGTFPLEANEGRSIAFSPDSNLLATIGRGFDSGGRLEVWQFDSGRKRFQVEIYGSCLAFSPDGRLIAAHAEIFDLRSTDRLEYLDLTPQTLAWMPDSGAVVSENE